jgi:hypothetical protein
MQMLKFKHKIYKIPDPTPMIVPNRSFVLSTRILMVAKSG